MHKPCGPMNGPWTLLSPDTICDSSLSVPKCSHQLHRYYIRIVLKPSKMSSNRTIMTDCYDRAPLSRNTGKTYIAHDCVLLEGLFLRRGFPDRLYEQSGKSFYS